MRVQQRRVKAILALALVWLFCATNCGSDEAQPQGTARASYKLPLTTKYIAPEQGRLLLDVADDGAQIVLDASSSLAQSLAAGDVLVAGITPKTPDGLLRKVTAKETTAAGVALQTAPATMEEAFEELDLSLARDVHYEELESYDSKLQGISIRRSSLQGIAAQRHGLTLDGSKKGFFELGFADTVIYDHDGNPKTTDDQVLADGSISFSIGVVFEAKIKWFKITRLKVGAEVSQDAQLTLHSTLAGYEFNKEVVVGKLRLAPFSIGPVVIRPQLELVLGCTGELKAELTASITEHAGAQAGIVYQDGRFMPYASRGLSWEFTPPELYLSAYARAYVGPRLNLMLYGVAGPYAQITGYLELTVDPQVKPWWELYGGIEGAMGIKGEILGKKFLQLHIGRVVELRVLIASAAADEDPPQCTSDCGARQCGVDRCGNACGSCGEGQSCKAGQCVGGTFTDPATGRTWMEATGSESGSMVDTYCMSQTAFGGGWRLPTIDELRTLIEGCADTEDGGACAVSDSCATMSTTCDKARCGGCAASKGPGAGGCYWGAEIPGECGRYISDNYAYGGRWQVDFTTGAVTDEWGSGSTRIRCVR